MYRMPSSFFLTGCYNHHFIALPLIEFSAPVCFVAVCDFILSLPTAALPEIFHPYSSHVEQIL